jgi:O-antigen ligase
MPVDRSIIKVFLAGVFISAFAFSVKVLDPTLTPRFVCLSVTLLAAMFFVIRNAQKIKAEWNMITVPYFLFTAFCVISICWAHTKSEAIFESSKVVLGLIVFSISLFCLDKEIDLFKDLLFKISIAMVFIGAGVAVYQFSKTNGYSKEMLYNITSINGHKNLYSSFLFLNLFFLIRSLKHFKGLWKIVACSAIVISTLVIVFMQTKAVWLGLGTAAGVGVLIFITSWIKWKPNFYLSLIGWILLTNLFFIYGAPKIIERGIGHNTALRTDTTAKQKKAELDNERLMLWKKTYEMIKKHPVYGVGMGNWQIYFPDATLEGMWRAEDLNFTFQRPHNDLLWILSETGWLGFNIFLVFIFTVLMCLLRAIRSAVSDWRLQFELITLPAFIFGFMVIAFFDFPKERIEHIIWFNILLAFAYKAIREHSELRSFGSVSFSGSFLVFPAGLVVILVWIGVMRFKGEYHTRKMYDSRAMNNDRRAIEEGNMALNYVYRLDPTSLPVRWYTANSYANLKELEKAEQEFEEAVKDNPYNRNVLNDLGSAYSVNGKDPLAKPFYREAIRISPRFDDPKLNLASIYAREQNWPEVDTLLKQTCHESERKSQLEKMVLIFKKPAGQ